MGLWFRPSGAPRATTGGRLAAHTAQSVTTVWKSLTTTVHGSAPALAWYALVVPLPIPVSCSSSSCLYSHLTHHLNENTPSIRFGKTDWKVAHMSSLDAAFSNAFSNVCGKPDLKTQVTDGSKGLDRTLVVRYSVKVQLGTKGSVPWYSSLPLCLHSVSLCLQFWLTMAYA